MNDAEYRSALRALGYHPGSENSGTDGTWTALATNSVADFNPGGVVKFGDTKIVRAGDTLTRARLAVLEAVVEREAMRHGTRSLLEATQP